MCHICGAGTAVHINYTELLLNNEIQRLLLLIISRLIKPIPFSKIDTI